MKCNRGQWRAFFFPVRMFNCKTGQGIVPLAECNRMGLEVFVLRDLFGLTAGMGGGGVSLRQGCCGVSMPVNDMFVVLANTDTTCDFTKRE